MRSGHSTSVAVLLMVPPVRAHGQILVFDIYMHTRHTATAERHTDEARLLKNTASYPSPLAQIRSFTKKQIENLESTEHTGEGSEDFDRNCCGRLLLGAGINGLVAAQINQCWCRPL